MAAAHSLTNLVDHLRRRCGSGPTDGELLAEFAARRDEAAFAELVGRHGGLVFGVARRHLADRQAAEDVVQVTFAALARSASRLGRPPSLVNWLYTVALRQARTVRRHAARRSRDISRISVPALAHDPLAEVSGRELLTIIDDELARLPEQYRQPLLLCALEGLSREEAARRLGWPAGSVKGRLERGRELLRERLAKRGLTVPAVLAGGLLASPSEAMPAALVTAVTRAAVTLPAAGVGLRAVAVILTAAATGIGLGATVWPGPAAGDTPPAKMAATVVEMAKPPAELPAGALFRFGSNHLRQGTAAYAATLSPDGKRLATTAMYSTAVWDVATGKITHWFPSSFAPYTSGGLCFSPDGRRLANIRSELARVWDLETGKEIWRVEQDPMAKNDRRSWSYCQFTEDGNTLILDEGKKAVFRDLRSGAITRRLSADDVFLISRDASTYVRRDRNDGVVVGSVATGRESKRIDYERDSRPNSGETFAISSDGRMLALADGHKTVRVIDLPGGDVRMSFAVPESAKYLLTGRKQEYWYFTLNFSADGRTLIMGTAGGEIHRWDTATHADLPVLKTPASSRSFPNRVSAIDITPDNRTLVSSGEDGRVRIWDLTNNQEIPAPDTYTGRVHAAFSADGRQVAVADDWGRIDLWDPLTGKRIRTIRTAGPAVRNLVFTPDGRMLIAGQSSDVAQFWELPSGREAKSFQKIGGDVWINCLTVLISPNGQFLYVDDYPHRSRLWDVTTGDLRWEGKHDFGAAFTPDGKTIVAAQSRGVIALVDTATGAIKRTLADEGSVGGDFRAVAVSPNGRWFAAPLGGETVAVYDLASGSEYRRWKAAEPLRGIEAAMGSRVILTRSVAFSPENLYLATADIIGSIRVWDVFASEEVMRFEGHERGASTLSFGPDGRTLLSAGDDGQALLWSLKPPTNPAATLDGLWADLDGDVAKAYRAMWNLSAAPGGVAFLRGKLAPATLPDRDRLAKLVADLDSTKFNTREVASKELASFGLLAVPFLEETLRGKVSPELRSRVQGLINASRNGPTSTDVQLFRAVRALELAATPAAREHLKALAAGAPGATVTRAAAEALQRLPK